ncbi:MAG: prepilin-type N-terminal cleavage/methylation domain-containing protein [Bacilli bacterium]|nr:prepilin-type N-terminal cleavage/methylation domain-containing protein [Bacilli bacterium]
MNKKGFTLVELLAVIVVLIIIVFIAINKINESTKKTKENTVKANAIAYIKGVNNLLDEDSLVSTRLKNGIYDLNTLDEYGVKLSGTKPDEALVITYDYDLYYACLRYGQNYFTYHDGKLSEPRKKSCKHYSVNSDEVTTYAYNGSYHTFTATHPGYYKIELWGASSGCKWRNNTDSDGGGYASGELLLTKGESIYIYIGEQGKSGGGSNPYGGPVGGYNGGGYGGNSASTSGGGATDVRLIASTWNDSASLASRIMVAGGGGGSDDGCSSGNDGRGGAGGGISGIGAWISGGYNSQYAATQTTGNAFGIGANSTTGTDTGGAGGGYWGGLVTNHGNGGAGGGSGYISGLKGCIAITSETDTTPKCETGSSIDCSIHYSGKQFRNAKLKSGSELFSNYDTGEQERGNLGNGYARITYTGI